MKQLDEFKSYLIDCGKSENTTKSYIRSIRKYTEWYETTYGTSMSGLERNAIIRYREHMINSLNFNKKSINSILSAIVKYNQYLIDIGVQEQIVVSKSDYIKVQVLDSNPCKIGINEVEMFVEEVQKKESKRNYAIITILAYAGLRVSECLDLYVEDVDLVKKVIHVCKSHERMVDINSKIIDAIRDYLEERNKESHYLFVSQKSNKLDRTRVNEVCKKYSNKITPSMLRHFYCANALESGKYSIKEVAKQAGHIDIRTTYLYKNRLTKKEKL